MWNNHCQSDTDVRDKKIYGNPEGECLEASSTQSGGTLEFRGPYPPLLGKTYSRFRSLVDRPDKRSSPIPNIHLRPSPILNFLKTFRQRQRAKLKKFPSFPFPAPSTNVAFQSVSPSPSEGLEMEIFYKYTSTEPSEKEFKAESENEFPIPTLVSGQVQPRSRPGLGIYGKEMDVDDGNNNDADDKEFQWSDEQLEILESAKDAFRFHQRTTTDLVFKELRSMKNGKRKPCSKTQIRALLEKADESFSEMQVRAWLEKANIGFSFTARSEHRSLKLMTCDQAEGAADDAKEGRKVHFNEEVKVKKIVAFGAFFHVERIKD